MVCTGELNWVFGLESDDVVVGGSANLPEDFRGEFKGIGCSTTAVAVDKAEGFGLVLGVTFRSDPEDFCSCLARGGSSTIAFCMGERGFGGSSGCTAFSLWLEISSKNWERRLISSLRGDKGWGVSFSDFSWFLQLFLLLLEPDYSTVPLKELFSEALEREPSSYV
jgi:hypothetical protein